MFFWWNLNIMVCEWRHVDEQQTGSGRHYYRLSVSCGWFYPAGRLQALWQAIITPSDGWKGRGCNGLCCQHAALWLVLCVNKGTVCGLRDLTRGHMIHQLWSRSTCFRTVQICCGSGLIILQYIQTRSVFRSCFLLAHTKNLRWCFGA